MQRRVFLALVLALTLVGCAPPANPPAPPAPEARPSPERDAAAQAPVDHLLKLVRDRLLVQHDVARYKYHARLPIPDAKREQQLLEKVEEQARALGLKPDFIREFFQAQIEAGKRIQQADFDSWKQGTRPPPDGPDLTALRSQIDALNRQLLEALKDSRSVLKQPESRKMIQDRAATLVQGKGISAEVRRTACAPLF